MNVTHVSGSAKNLMASCSVLGNLASCSMRRVSHRTHGESSILLPLFEVTRMTLAPRPLSLAAPILLLCAAAAAAQTAPPSGQQAAPPAVTVSLTRSGVRLAA